MIESLATRHRQKVEAGERLPASPLSTVLTDTDRLMLAALSSDKARLKRLRSKHGKDKLKAALLDKYRDYFTQIINREQSSHNEVLVTVCIWAIDAGDYKTALTLADYALIQGMKSPEGFTRTLPEVITEEFSDKAIKLSNPNEMRGTLQQLQQLIADSDIFDEVSAKLYKALGLAWLSEDREQALKHFETAQRFGASVKRQVSRLRKELNKNEYHIRP